jgi:hypothetical protein
MCWVKKKGVFVLNYDITLHVSGRETRVCLNRSALPYSGWWRVDFSGDSAIAIHMPAPELSDAGHFNLLLFIRIRVAVAL